MIHLANLPPHLHIISRNTVYLRKYQSLCCWSPTFYVAHVGFRGDNMTRTDFALGIQAFPCKSLLIPVFHSVTALSYLPAKQFVTSSTLCLDMYFYIHIDTWIILTCKDIYYLHVVSFVCNVTFMLHTHVVNVYRILKQMCGKTCPRVSHVSYSRMPKVKRGFIRVVFLSAASFGIFMCCNNFSGRTPAPRLSSQL